MYSDPILIYDPKCPGVIIAYLILGVWGECHESPRLAATPPGWGCGYGRSEKEIPFETSGFDHRRLWRTRLHVSLVVALASLPVEDALLAVFKPAPHVAQPSAESGSNAFLLGVFEEEPLELFDLREDVGLVWARSQ